MEFINTRDSSDIKDLSYAVLHPMGSHSGLYVPKKLPKFDDSEIKSMRNMSYCELGAYISNKMTGIDYAELLEFYNSAMKSFAASPIKLHNLEGKKYILELFHGPTAAFKDFALQFLPKIIEKFDTGGKRCVVIGATSGDTGSAAINGFMQGNFDIFIMHPYNLTSDLQRKQMTTIKSDKVHNIAVRGNYDDAQKYLKKLLQDKELNEKYQLISVNSINFARLVPQVIYYFWAYLQLNTDSKVIFSVPTGNFGDILSGFYAKQMGLPIEKLVISNNSNDILHRFLNKNDYSISHFVPTYAPSMDILKASNFERLLHFYYGDSHKVAELFAELERNQEFKVDSEILSRIRKSFASTSTNNQEILDIIKYVYNKYNYLVDPHTATGLKYVLSNEPDTEFLQTRCQDVIDDLPVICLATAHPDKFSIAMTESLGDQYQPSLQFLQEVMNLPEKFDILDSSYEEIKDFIISKVA